MRQMMNHSNFVLAGIRNLSKTDAGDELGIFTETEVNTLWKMINETDAWWTERQAAQAAKQPHEEPAFTMAQVGEKVSAFL